MIALSQLNNPEHGGFKAWNLRTAFHLGLRIPHSVIITCDELKQLGQNPIDDFYLIEEWCNTIENTIGKRDYAVRSSPVYSAPGMLKTVYVKNTTQYRRSKLAEAIKTVYDSWFNKQHQFYRKVSNLSPDLQMGILVQELLPCTLPGSRTGIIFTRDLNTGAPGIVGEFLIKSYGDTQASGKVTPQPLVMLEIHHHEKLQMAATKIEEFYGEVQEIEFAIIHGNLYILQIRKAQATAQAHLAAQKRQNTVFNNQIAQKSKYGIPASPGKVKGQIWILGTPAPKGDSLILVADFTTTSDIKEIYRAGGILTRQGGFTSHAAQISRKLQIPALIAVKQLKILNPNQIQIENTVLNNGDWILMDATVGDIQIIEPQNIPH